MGMSPGASPYDGDILLLETQAVSASQGEVVVVELIVVVGGNGGAAQGRYPAQR